MSSTTIVDAEDAVLFAQAEVQEWQEAFLREWYGPVGATMMAIVMSRVPPDVLAAMQKINPQGQDALAAIIASGGK